METNIKRTTMNITTYCNLKCKHCLAYIPYEREPRNIKIEEAKKNLEKYFEVVDSVEHFTVTGGEPLLNKDVCKIIEEVHKYDEKIRGSVDMVTNATIKIPTELLDILEKHRDKSRVILSDYGENLSKEITTISNELDKRNITYRISKLNGDNLYYNGWIDFTNHDLKWKTIEERDRNAQKCIHRVGKYLLLINGEIHCCTRSYWRMKQGIIPKKVGEYVPLMDEAISIEGKRDLLMKMIEMKSSTSCAYCVGLCNDVERVIPAQQL